MDYNNRYANAAYSAESQYGYGQPPGYGAQYAQQPQQPAPIQIRNPFAAPPPPASVYAGQNAQFDPDYEQQIAQWNATYAPIDPLQQGRKGGKPERADNANFAALGQRGAMTTPAASAEAAEFKSKDSGKYTVVRKGGGEQWEDKSLLEWDPQQFRIMVGNLAGEVTDDSLAKAFAAYDVSRAKVIRDKRTTKSKGYGFVAFVDHDKGFKAAREMVGKYIGSHPVTIQRAKTSVAPVVKKDQHKNKGRNNQHNKSKNDKGTKDVTRANTGAGIEKKSAKPTAPSNMKFLG